MIRHHPLEIGSCIHSKQISYGFILWNGKMRYVWDLNYMAVPMKERNVTSFIVFLVLPMFTSLDPVLVLHTLTHKLLTHYFTSLMIILHQTTLKLRHTFTLTNYCLIVYVSRFGPGVWHHDFVVRMLWLISVHRGELLIINFLSMARKLHRTAWHGRWTYTCWGVVAQLHSRHIHFEQHSSE